MSYDAVIHTPVGLLGLQVAQEQLVAVHLLSPDNKEQKASTPLAKEAVGQLESYFQNKLQQFDLPLAPAGTQYQKKVWQSLAAIPFGSTKSYGAIAKELATGPRAVGNCCRRNPLIIIVPCHRVVAHNHLGGYSGQRLGQFLEVKKWLLEHEGVS